MLKILLILILLFFIFDLFKKNYDNAEFNYLNLKFPESYEKFNIYQEDRNFY